tara:strand:+ start:1293 stop:2618 length:1326 start_codon:yes stop_codon:yes gene_type:complete
MSNHILIKNKINPFKNIIKVASDKSLSLRCVLLASVAIGVSRISNLLESEDVKNALKTIKKLGINYKKKNGVYKIEGFGLNGYNSNNKITINAGNSGTLGRLILGLCVKSKKKIKLIGDNSLSKRDFSRVIEPLKLFGVNIKSNNSYLPVEILGTEFLRPINYLENRGSAQCKSAVMLAALHAPGITKLKAKKSRNHTEILFKHLNIPLKIKSKGEYDLIELKGLNQFNSFDYQIPGDISSSAFFIVLTLLSRKSKIIIKKININERRIGIVKILNAMNSNIIFKNKKVYKGEKIADIYVKSVNKFKAINCPANFNSFAIDEFLIIFLVAAKANGISIFRNLGELNKKESPRLDIAINFLKMIGIRVKRKKDDIKIYGKPNLSLNGEYIVKNFLKDHRVFMMACIAALTFGGNWKINDKDSINTSFPKFLNILKSLGAKIS